MDPSRYAIACPSNFFCAKTTSEILKHIFLVQIYILQSNCQKKFTDTVKRTEYRTTTLQLDFIKIILIKFYIILLRINYNQNEF